MRFARIFTAVLLLIASAVSAQVPSANSAVVLTESSASSRHEGLPRENNTYGTAALTWMTLTPWDFHPINTSTTYEWASASLNGTFGIYRTGGNSLDFEAGLHLPEGAVVSVLEIAGCDTDSFGDLFADFRAVLKTGPEVGAQGEAVTNGSSGCQVVSNSTGPFSWTVNNATTYYTVEVAFPTTGASLILNSVRVGYKLQVSPHAGAATFNDVPLTHPFNKFVEALYQSGITAGCGNNNFCPDAPVTRGQMAVFLSAALGLHWAP